jgi:hypothetical protein
MRDDAKGGAPRRTAASLWFCVRASAVSLTLTGADRLAPSDRRAPLCASTYSSIMRACVRRANSLSAPIFLLSRASMKVVSLSTGPKYFVVEMFGTKKFVPATLVVKEASLNLPPCAAHAQ